MTGQTHLSNSQFNHTLPMFVFQTQPSFFSLSYILFTFNTFIFGLSVVRSALLVCHMLFLFSENCLIFSNPQPLCLKTMLLPGKILHRHNHQLSLRRSPNYGRNSNILIPDP